MSFEKGGRCLPAAAIIVVVVENDDAAQREMRIGSLEAEGDGIVPVAIDMGEGDPPFRREENGLVEKSLDEPDAPVVDRHAEARELCSDLFV